MSDPCTEQEGASISPLSVGRLNAMLDASSSSTVPDTREVIDPPTIKDQVKQLKKEVFKRQQQAAAPTLEAIVQELKDTYATQDKCTEYAAYITKPRTTVSLGLIKLAEDAGLCVDVDCFACKCDTTHPGLCIGFYLLRAPSIVQYSDKDHESDDDDIPDLLEQVD